MRYYSNHSCNKVVIIQGKYSINPKQEISHPHIQGQAFQDVVGDVKSFQQQFQNLSLGQNHNNNEQNAQFGGNIQRFGCPDLGQVDQRPQKNVEIKQEIKLILNMIIDLKIIRTKRKWPFNQYKKNIIQLIINGYQSFWNIITYLIYTLAKLFIR